MNYKRQNVEGKYKDYQSNYYDFCEPYIKENLDNLVQQIKEKELIWNIIE